MENVNVLPSSLPQVDPWGLSVSGTSMPVESFAWMDEDGVPVIRLFVASASASGHEVVVSFNGVVTMVVAMKVTINKPFAVTIRYVESTAA